MQADLQFSDAVYGIGAGIFFIGYFIFEVPSNLLMTRAGARLWIARIMISWGLISSALMFTNSVTNFVAALVMVLAARHSDRSGERHWHTAFAAPYLVGAIRDATGSTASGIYLIAASLLAGAVLVVAAVKPR